MAITLMLEDDVVAELKDRAKRQQLSVEQLAARILTEAAASSERVMPREAVARIQATPPNPAQVRPATASLAELLNGAPGDPGFDLESWRRQWSVAEAELRAMTRANEVAEGRGQ